MRKLDEFVKFFQLNSKMNFRRRIRTLRVVVLQCRHSTFCRLVTSLVSPGFGRCACFEVCYCWLLSENRKKVIYCVLFKEAQILSSSPVLWVGVVFVFVWKGRPKCVWFSVLARQVQVRKRVFLASQTTWSNFGNAWPADIDQRLSSLHQYAGNQVCCGWRWVSWRSLWC